MSYVLFYWVNHILFYLLFYFDYVILLLNPLEKTYWNKVTDVKWFLVTAVAIEYVCDYDCYFLLLFISHSFQASTDRGCVSISVIVSLTSVWCLPPVWNLRAVIWFHFAIASHILLPHPFTLSILSFSAGCSFLLNFFQKIIQYFSLRDRLFCMTPV